jgi:hypothetical protein
MSNTTLKANEERLYYHMPVELLFSANHKLVGKIREPQMAYSITKEQFDSLQERAKKEHLSFEQALFEEMRTSFLNSEITKFYIDEYKMKHPQTEKISMDMKLAGTVIEGKTRDNKTKRKTKLYAVSKQSNLLRTFYLFLLLVFIMAVIGVFYAAFHRT